MTFGKFIFGSICAIITTVLLFWGVVEMVWKFRDITDEIEAVQTELATYKDEVERIRQTVILIETKNEELRNTLGVLDEKNAQSSSNIDRMESLRNELAMIESRLNSQEQEVAKVGNLATRVDTIEETVQNLPGPPRRTFQCTPLNERVLLSKGKSYDFCGTDFTLQIVDLNGETVWFPEGRVAIPGTVPKNAQGCSLEILEAVRGDDNERQVDVRARCDN